MTACTPDEKYSVDDIFRIADSKDKSKIPVLVELLDCAYGARYLGVVASALGELGVNSAVPRIVELLFDTHTCGNKGSFAYALTLLDCSNHIIDIVPMLSDASFEVRSKIITVIENTIDSITDDVRSILIDELQRQITTSPPPFDKIKGDLLTAIEILTWKQ